MSGSAAATPDFNVTVRDDLPQKFALECRGGLAPSAAEQRYLDQLAETLGRVCALHDEAAIAARQAPIRDAAVAQLRKTAVDFAKTSPGAARDAGAEQQARECLRIEGRYRERFARIATVPFIVKVLDADGKVIDLVKDTGARFCNVELLTRDVFISAAQASLKTNLDGALSVVKVVFAERENRAASPLRFSTDVIDALRARRHDYVQQLYGIATVGLGNVDPTQAPFAMMDLARFRAEFCDREAGLVKNGYLWRLGFWCTLALALAAGGYAAARLGYLGPLGSDLRNFMLLVAGGAVGTWLSFSLRREILTFEDLAVLERDQLDPGMRVLFITGLVTVAGLLFWSRAVTVGIGDFATYDAVHVHGSWALLAGLLAGIAERALATVVSKRAGDFVGTMGAKVDGWAA